MKKKLNKRILAAILSVSMCVGGGLSSLNVFAENTPEGTPGTSSESSSSEETGSSSGESSSSEETGSSSGESSSSEETESSSGESNSSEETGSSSGESSSSDDIGSSSRESDSLEYNENNLLGADTGSSFDIEIGEGTPEFNVKRLNGSDNVSCESHLEVMNENNQKIVHIYLDYTITDPKADQREIVLRLDEDAVALLSKYPSMPGDYYQLHITVNNQSIHNYRYKDDSLVLATPDLSYELTNESSTGFIGFDDQEIPYSFVGAIPVCEPINDLFGKENASFEDMLNLYDILATKGYVGENPLTTYILSYYSKESGTQFSDVYEMVEKYPAIFYGLIVTKNYQFKVTEEQLGEFEAKYGDTNPVFNYMCITGSGNSKTVQFKWPEPELAALSYRYFYSKGFALAIGGEDGEVFKDSKVRDDQDPTFVSRSVIRYMGHGDNWNNANKYLAQTFDSLESLETTGFMEELAFSKGLSNAFQLYDFGWHNTIVLEQVDTSYSVVHEYYTSTDGGEFVLDGSVPSTENVKANVGDVIKVADLEKAAAYNGNTYTYKSANPDEEMTIVSDPAENVVTLRYERTVTSTSSTPSSTPDDPYIPRPRPSSTPSEEVIPDESTPLVSPEEIAEEETPLSPPPAVTEEATEEILEDEVPLVAPPKTGSAAGSALAILGAALGLGLVITRKKK